MTPSLFPELEAALSPHAKHAYETYLIAFWRGSESTIREIRAAITLLYGEAIDRELQKHLEDRCAAVLPK